MRINIIQLLDQCEKRMGGYVALEHYRYLNICTKAEPASLIAVEIAIGDSVLKLEDVCDVTISAPDRFELFPDNMGLIPQITLAIQKEHPEFDFDTQPVDENDPDGDRKILLVMPVVNKDRYDACMQLIDAFHTDCRTHLDKEYASLQKKMMAELQGTPPSIADEATQELKRKYEWHLDLSRQATEEKQKEVEDAYQRYLTEAAAQEQLREEQDAARGDDAGTFLQMETAPDDHNE